jgi:hypothetical protein
LRTDDIEVCLKAPPGRDVDLVIAADLATFTKVWLGYVGLVAASDRPPTYMKAGREGPGFGEGGEVTGRAFTLPIQRKIA